MTNRPDIVAEPEWERLKRTFITGQEPRPALTPHTVASTMRLIGLVAGDADVLAVYEALRREAAVPDLGARLLAEHKAYRAWQQAVVDSETVLGFFEWKEQRHG